MAHSTITLSSLYSSGQCLLSVLGSIGVILLFAGIPQLIYAPQVNFGNLMTFLLGALLISLMVAGNAFIGYKYRQLIRERREEQRIRGQTLSAEDKPPSYDDVFKEEGLPPAYTSVTIEKPPRYEDLTSEGINWSQIPRATSSFCLQSSSCNRTPRSNRDTPILVPLHRSATFDISESSRQNRTRTSRAVVKTVSEPSKSLQKANKREPKN